MGNQTCEKTIVDFLETMVGPNDMANNIYGGTDYIN
jgi:hypothetical protein